MIYRYTMQEIRELYHEYKTPVFKSNQAHRYSGNIIEPGNLINVANNDDMVSFYEFDKKMSFMEFLEYYGPRMKKRKLEEKTNKLIR